MQQCFDSFINKTLLYKICIVSGVQYIKEVIFLSMSLEKVVPEVGWTGDTWQFLADTDYGQCKNSD